MPIQALKTIKFKNMGTKLYDKQGNPILNKDGSHKRGEHTVYVGEQLDITVKFGEEVDIPEVYTRPNLCVNGARGPSPIEQLAPQLEPVDPAFREEWMKPPLPQPLPHQVARGAAAPVTLESLMASGLNRGLAEQMLAAINAARAQKASG